MIFFKKAIDIFEKPSLGNYWFAVKAIRIDAYDFGSASITGNTIETIITLRNTEMHKGAPGSKCSLYARPLAGKYVEPGEPPANFILNSRPAVATTL